LFCFRRISPHGSPPAQSQSSAAAVLAEYQDIIRQYLDDDTIGALHALLSHDRAWVSTAVGALCELGVSLQDVKSGARPPRPLSGNG
jgi:hypothetical protein